MSKFKFEATIIVLAAALSAPVHALDSRSVTSDLRDKNSLNNPAARARIAANAATARRGPGGWWRHRNGGYGWVGPLFWPFAYYDFYGYALWGYGYDDSFWNYGYDDIYAGLFSPYSYEDLAGYLPKYSDDSPQYPSRTVRRGGRPTTAGSTTSDQLAQMCGEDTRNIAGLPIDQIQQAIQPDEQQRAALDDLANSSEMAAQIIKDACPVDIALTASGRMQAMKIRIKAMLAAIDVMQPSLERFYELLDDEQKARLTALGSVQLEDRTTGGETAGGSLAKNCGAAQAGVINWPTADIERVVRPTEAQYVSLAKLQSAAAKAADMLRVCLSDNPLLTPSARLEVVNDRLETMLQAVNTVHTALDTVYGELSDGQKAQFTALGLQPISEVDDAVLPEGQPRAKRTHVRRHHGIGLRSILRRFGL